MTNKLKIFLQKSMPYCKQLIGTIMMVILSYTCWVAIEPYVRTFFNNKSTTATIKVKLQIDGSVKITAEGRGDLLQYGCENILETINNKNDK